MLKVNSAKTKLARKSRKPIVIDVIIILIVAVLFGGFWFIKNSGEKLHINGYSYRLSVAKTAAQQSRDLGRRTSLTANQAFCLLSPTKLDVALIWKAHMYHLI